MQRSGTNSRFAGYVPSIVAATLLLATLAFDAFTYAALAAHSEVGKAFRSAIESDSPLIQGHIALGNLLRGLPGLAGVGDDTANAAAAPLVERIRSFPPGASAVFFGSPQSTAQSRMLWTHRLLPYLLGLTLVLWWRRQKPVHLRQRLRA